MSDDAQLIAAIAKGDQKAMHQFYQRYSGIVYQFAFKTAQNGADAAEIMNTVMLEVWRSADRFRGDSKVKTWLLGITHNRAVDSLRSTLRHDSDDIDDHPNEEDSACPIDEVLSASRQINLVQRCMKQLKSHHRQVVHLTLFEELSYPEIGKILDLPNGTVKTRMMHARNLLQRCLSGFERGVVT